MSKKSIRIVFMGTPDFAVPGLRTLVEGGYDVAAVITAPDRPAGRGLKQTSSPVKQYAVSQGIEVLQPEKLRDKEFLERLRLIRADLQVVIAFRMLPEVVWNMPSLGTFNLHASLLPQYRGAAPINWAVINGERISGVTTFFLEKEIDTGKIIFQESVEIGPDETAGELYERLMNIGAGLVAKTVDAVAAGVYPQEEQADNGELKPAPKIFKETCEIDWSQGAAQIHNFVRGLAPFPTAWTRLNGHSFKVYGVRTGEELSEAETGSVDSDGKKFIRVKAADRWVYLTDIQLEGRKRMPVEDLLRGWKL